MYSLVLRTHSVLRWLIIIAGLFAVVRAWRATASPGPAKAPASGMVFMAFFDVQVLVGLILHLTLSPITTVALHRFGAVMSNDVARFWVVEHPFGMLVALSLAHLGRVSSRRGVEDSRRRRRAAICFTLALVIVLISVPWPFMAYGRSLL